MNPLLIFMVDDISDYDSDYYAMCIHPIDLVLALKYYFPDPDIGLPPDIASFTVCGLVLGIRYEKSL
jgi:hypothetical protein